MPGCSGEPVVTTLVCFIFYHTRGCGCIERPVFPAPSDWRVRKLIAKLGRLAPRDRGLISLNVIARSNATTASAVARRAKEEAIQLTSLPQESWIASLRSQ